MILHGRPPSFVEHFKRRLSSGSQVKKANVGMLADGIFEVKSLSIKAVYHMVDFGQKSFPSCTCEDWKRLHLPCKHFCAVFKYFPGWQWTHLRENYKHAPYFQLFSIFRSESLPARPINCVDPSPNMKDQQILLLNSTEFKSDESDPELAMIAYQVESCLGAYDTGNLFAAIATKAS